MAPGRQHEVSGRTVDSKDWILVQRGHNYGVVVVEMPRRVSERRTSSSAVADQVDPYSE